MPGRLSRCLLSKQPPRGPLSWPKTTQLFMVSQLPGTLGQTLPKEIQGGLLWNAPEKTERSTIHPDSDNPGNSRNILFSRKPPEKVCC
ncbi:Hypothetical predicted protein [Podarcis lilfordi]|uniref:Uncharacterized protein n=1 Tax=Podarcis lilfordi TaxID=74358 RepID=A0AA35JTL9_9SAUR|nr:Hypothetical predicted protein [Podarcis lilfordi]